MAIWLEEYNKNQRVYNRSQNENKYSENDKDEKNGKIEKNEKVESYQNTTQYVRGKDNQNTRSNENDNAAQYIRSKENHNIMQLVKEENSEEYNNAMGVHSGANPFRQKSRPLWKIKTFYSIIIIVIFLFTPFLITISMTGVIESNISDSLVEVRRVNVKYKNGSQAIDISKYIIGVLASRLSLSSQVEVLKAESIMIRTEIYRCMGDKMDIDSTDLNLVYLSEKEMQTLWGDSYTDNYNLIVDCISATSGRLINCNGQLIEPMYHEVSAGKTRNASQVFSGSTTDYSYLTSVV